MIEIDTCVNHRNGCSLTRYAREVVAPTPYLRCVDVVETPEIVAKGIH